MSEAIAKKQLFRGNGDAARLIAKGEKFEVPEGTKSGESFDVLVDESKFVPKKHSNKKPEDDLV